MDHSSAAAQPAQTVQAPAQEQTGTTHHAPYTGPVDTFFYDNAIVRLFVIATVVFGLIGMLVGVLIAVQLYYPDANFGRSLLTAASGRCTPTLSFSRLWAMPFLRGFTTAYSAS